MILRSLFAASVVLGSFVVVGCGDDTGGESTPQNTTPAVKSRRGESCASRNDCTAGLSCIQNRCIDNEYPVDPTAKECFLVECTDTAQCCADFSPDPESCSFYQEQCNLGDELYCQDYQDFCVCSQQCVDEQCIDQGPACTSDLQCGSFFCVGGQCVQCRNNEECGGGGLSCVEGFCTPGCVKNEECPLFNSCESGQCVETGCTSDRECILFTGRPEAVCKEGQCTVDCESNAECGQLEACTDGKCIFIGCETNDDCRAALHIENQDISAVCREPAE
jgi:hypothetical protein